MRKKNRLRRYNGMARLDVIFDKSTSTIDTYFCEHSIRIVHLPDNDGEGPWELLHIFVL